MMQTLPSCTDEAMRSVSSLRTQSLLPATTVTGQVMRARSSGRMSGSVSIMRTSGSSPWSILVSAMPFRADGFVFAPQTNSLDGTSGCSIANIRAIMPPSLKPQMTGLSMPSLRMKS